MTLKERREAWLAKIQEASIRRFAQNTRAMIGEATTVETNTTGIFIIKDTLEELLNVFPTNPIFGIVLSPEDGLSKLYWHIGTNNSDTETWQILNRLEDDLV